MYKTSTLEVQVPMLYYIAAKLSASSPLSIVKCSDARGADSRVNYVCRLPMPPMSRCITLFHSIAPDQNQCRYLSQHASHYISSLSLSDTYRSKYNCTALHLSSIAGVTVIVHFCITFSPSVCTSVCRKPLEIKVNNSP